MRLFRMMRERRAERRKEQRRRAVMLDMMRELSDMAADGLLNCRNPGHGHHKSAER